MYEPDLYGMWIHSNSPVPLGPTDRVKWVWDAEYSTSFAPFLYKTDEKVKAAEAEEIDKLEMGELVALGCILETRCSECGKWRQVDSLWGIVIGSDEKDLVEFYTGSELGDCFEKEAK